MTVLDVPELSLVALVGVTGSGLKCRGREYLRIIYGPDYTAPDQLERLG